VGQGSLRPGQPVAVGGRAGHQRLGQVVAGSDGAMACVGDVWQQRRCVKDGGSDVES
jgi:hypothetical protein